MEKLRSLALALVVLFLCGSVFSVPLLLPVQGKLQGNNVGDVNQSLPMYFRFYSAAAGGTALWDVNRVVDVNVVDVDNNIGVFTVLLGETVLLDINTSTDFNYLGIQIMENPEMSPRIRLASAPYALYALRAENAGLLDGNTSLFYTNADNINAGTLDPARYSQTTDTTIDTNQAAFDSIQVDLNAMYCLLSDSNNASRLTYSVLADLNQHFYGITDVNNHFQGIWNAAGSTTDTTIDTNQAAFDSVQADLNKMYNLVTDTNNASRLNPSAIACDGNTVPTGLGECQTITEFHIQGAGASADINQTDVNPANVVIDNNLHVIGDSNLGVTDINGNIFVHLGNQSVINIQSVSSMPSPFQLFDFNWDLTSSTGTGWNTGMSINVINNGSRAIDGIDSVVTSHGSPGGATAVFGQSNAYGGGANWGIGIYGYTEISKNTTSQSTGGKFEAANNAADAYITAVDLTSSGSTPANAGLRLDPTSTFFTGIDFNTATLIKAGIDMQDNNILNASSIKTADLNANGDVNFVRTETDYLFVNGTEITGTQATDTTIDTNQAAFDSVQVDLNAMYCLLPDSNNSSRLSYTVIADAPWITSGVTWSELAALFPVPDANVADNITVNWTGLDTYPSGCPPDQYISTIGDTLTCGVPIDTNGGGLPDSTIDTNQAAFDSVQADLNKMYNLVLDSNNASRLNPSAIACDGNTVPTGLGACQTISEFYIQGAGATTTDTTLDNNALAQAYYWSNLSGLFPVPDANVADNITVNWTGLDTYPGACETGEYVSTIGDTLTCSRPTDTNVSSVCSDTNSVLTADGACQIISEFYIQGAASATTDTTIDTNQAAFDSVQVDMNAMYCLLSDSNNASRLTYTVIADAPWITSGVIWSELAVLFPVPDANVADNITVNWTGLDTYPNACPSGEFVSTIGDTLTCSRPTDTNVSTVCSDTNSVLTADGSCQIISEFYIQASGISYADANAHYVPYVGADYDVDLGVYGVTATDLNTTNIKASAVFDKEGVLAFDSNSTHQCWGGCN